MKSIIPPFRADEIDLRHIKPVRWAEIRRRIAVIEDYLEKGVRTDATAAEAAQKLGLTSLIHDGAVAGYSAPALLQWA